MSTALREKGRVDAATGRLYQAFTVPPDALSLRFFVHGGGNAAVRLWEEDMVVYEVAGPDDNDVRTPVSWDLVSLRGHRVRLSIEDPVAKGPLGFIGTTGFDLITPRNGR